MNSPAKRLKIPVPIRKNRTGNHRLFSGKGQEEILGCGESVREGALLFPRENFGELGLSDPIPPLEEWGFSECEFQLSVSAGVPPGLKTGAPYSAPN